MPLSRSPISVEQQRIQLRLAWLVIVALVVLAASRVGRMFWAAAP